MTNLIITAYCACQICCGSNAPRGITASGTIPTQNRTIATGRRDIPFGSRIVLFGQTYIVEDRMARRYDTTKATYIDVYFRRHSDAKKFGVKRI